MLNATTRCAEFIYRKNPRCLPFLRENGKGLTYLGLRGMHPTESLEDAISLCPSLRHLVVEMSVPLRYFSHPALEYIDLWANPAYGNPKHWSENKFAQHEHFLPALRKVRIVDEVLFSIAGLRLPVVISPEEPEGTWNYLGVDIIHSHFSLVRNDLENVGSYYEAIKADYEEEPHAMMGSEDSDEDGDSNDDPDDDEWLSGSDISSDVSEEYDSGSESEEGVDLISLEGALEIFRRRRAAVYASSTDDSDSLKE
ncbi:hypothetical protein J3A83DRAFT_2607079 [Scleroderma citrinum]